MSTSPYRRVAVAAGTAAACAMILVGCAEGPPDPQGLRAGAPAVRLYGTDGTMQNAFAAELADRTVVAGMKGTRPMTQLPADFVNRLLEIDSSLQDFLFAGETYDAVVISALAAELAGTPDPETVRTYIKGVTTGGEQCQSVTGCMALARAGRDLAYRGVSLTRGGFTDLGEPAAATYETLHFGADGFIDPGRSEFIGAGDLSRATGEEPPEPDPRVDLPPWEVEPLVFGGLLPETGGLAFAYPPIIAGARLAVEEINGAGGVFGVDVQWIDGDAGTDPEVARGTLASHVAAGVHIIIGPAASGVAEAVLPDAVAAKRIMFSPSNTAAELVEADHDGYYFRTAPPDSLQGAALADILLRDGVERIVIVARDDSYGSGLLRNASESLARFGVPPSAVTLLTYALPEETGDGAVPPRIPDLERLVSRIVEADPDGLVVIGFAEAAQLIQRLVDEGVALGG
jgi:ABC-type branched-subunit amino acid transport system substrate-binding protein